MSTAAPIQDVEIVKVQTSTQNELSDKLYRVCVFCDKVVRVGGTNLHSCSNLTGQEFFCPFCIRNNHHFRSSRNILILSFRAIIAYYYWKFYCEHHNTYLIYLYDLERYIERHMNIGLQNPVFSYDPNTFLWFIDFNRVGTGKGKAPYVEVVKTIDLMFEEFQIDQYCTQYVKNDIKEKFSTAIDLFYEKRKRPKDRRMLIPTLSGNLKESPEFWEATRLFVRSQMILK